MYKIKYTYDTGDSFKTDYNQIGYLELSWKNLDVAKDNLRRIKEHYNFYHCKFHLMSKKEKARQVEQFSTKDWFVEEYNFCLKLMTDDGVACQISAPWCGYFERLNEIEIVEDHSDRKISFR